PQSGTFFAPGSPRRKGVKQGIFFFLLTFVFVPLTGLLTAFLNVEPFLPAISAILFFFGGLLRVVYALMFESGEPGGKTLEEKVLGNTALFAEKKKAGELPPAQSIPVSTYAPPPGAGNWRDTNDLVKTPGSVTD